ncbi:iron-sulfur cluster assembly accessory protein [Paenibacillus hemerocallicola]|jgi:Fe-S cluster assembly iron-binding protein IscA|uniref:Iron-sulfur cluster assembly accessory protein n=1 Tax=Paenibacillus hemerocallicola TaxID=1172614 RepID=A0A5C4T8L0_9BACL|nr:iron-sulfur cluster biosynthesis family protein [Paenibacillus hemerocallicola]TNJ65361.1 iron-sulfur cluster assembly accessory protein [Paenibacillus hemerocallicola]
MNVKITRAAAKVLLKELEQEENNGLKVRVKVDFTHGNHVHYALGLDEPSEDDIVVTTDKGIEIVMEKNEAMLDGVKIDYLYMPNEGFVITNPSKGNTGDH